MDLRPIGVFDSGLGGLTVVKQLFKEMPNESIIYFGDTGRVPYGTKSIDTILNFTRQDIDFLKTFDVKMIIAACGTVSSVATEVGENCGVPFVGVVSSAAKQAVAHTENKKIGVLGTTATIKSGSYKKIINSLDPEIEVISQDCPLFVPMVEAGWFSQDDIVVKETARRYLKPITDAGCDTVILGCTHYPVLSAVIGDIVGEDVKLINMGKTTASYVKKYLTENDMLSDGKVENHFYVSDRPDTFKNTAEILLSGDMQFDVTRIDIERY